MEPVKIIGAGLAGCEAAWQLAQRGIPVELHEMKPEKMTPAHHSPEFAELVCSNSLRSDQLENAVGLLKEELRRCGSLIMSCADAHRVEAGGALAVDRHAFSQAVTEDIRTHPADHRGGGGGGAHSGGGAGHRRRRPADLRRPDGGDLRPVPGQPLPEFLRRGGPPGHL